MCIIIAYYIMLIRKDEKNRMVHRHKQTKKKKTVLFIYGSCTCTYIILYALALYLSKYWKLLSLYTSIPPEVRSVYQRRVMSDGRKLTLSNYHQT